MNRWRKIKYQRETKKTWQLRLFWFPESKISVFFFVGSKHYANTHNGMLICIYTDRSTYILKGINRTKSRKKSFLMSCFKIAKKYIHKTNTSWWKIYIDRKRNKLAIFNFYPQSIQYIIYFFTFFSVDFFLIFLVVYNFCNSAENSTCAKEKTVGKSHLNPIQRDIVSVKLFFFGSKYTREILPRRHTLWRRK